MVDIRGISNRMSMDDGKLKIAVLGSASVGKTAILKRFLFQSFTGRHEKSTGDIYTYSTEFDGKPIEMEITDVPGGNEFEDVRLQAIEYNEAFVLVYSCTEGLSFKEVTDLRDLIFEMKEAGCPTVVVENKVDLPKSTWFEGAAIIPKILEKAWETPHVKCSARQETDVSDIFELLIFKAEQGLRRPSRGSRSTYAFNAVQEVLNIIDEHNE